MGIAEASPATIAPLLLRNLATSLFVFADKTLINFSQKYKLFEIIRSLLVSSFLFFLRLLPSLFPSINPISGDRFPQKPPNLARYRTGGDLGISRALTQLLSIISQIPVSSRKYEVVRSLAERLIDENHREGVEELREVNRAVLSAAFDRTICQMEAAMLDRGFCREDGDGVTVGPVECGLARVVMAVLSRFASVRVVVNRSESSAEKMAAEALWLAGKMGGCGCGVEAVRRWASAVRLGRLSLSAEPRLQGSLVRTAAFLFKQLKEIEDDNDESEKQQCMQTKMRMLISWLPLLCRGSSGTDAPVLSIRERRELELVLEEIIETLRPDEQEQVLALWLHHFTHSSSSDWPNLHASYARWYNASRALVIHQNH